MSHHGGAVTSPPWGPEQLPPQVVGDGRGRTSAAIHPQSPLASSAVSGAGGGGCLRGDLWKSLSPSVFSLPSTLLCHPYPGGRGAPGDLGSCHGPSLVRSALNPRGHLCSVYLVLPVCVCVGTTVPLSLCLPLLLPPLSASPPLHMVSSLPYPGLQLPPPTPAALSVSHHLHLSQGLPLFLCLPGYVNKNQR